MSTSPLLPVSLALALASASGALAPTASPPPPPAAASTTRPSAAPSSVSSARPGAARWAWPLLPRPHVLRRFDAPAQPWLPGHRGVDLAGATGQAVTAPADGVIAFTGVVAGRPVVSVAHPDGLRSTYEPVVGAAPVGTPVTRGRTVGHLQAGHCATGACLHWGVRRGPDYLDPLSLVRGARIVLLPPAR